MEMSAERSGGTIEGRTGRIAILLLGSGLCSLVYQTVWLREMRGIFGSSTAATAAVIGIFMGGLGLGGYLLGRRADRHPNPLQLYSMLEFGVALSALATIPLGWLVGKLYIASGGSLQLGLTVATILRLFLAIVLLGVPTLLMGGTLPAVARAAVEDSDVKRRALAVLYGVNTIGAVLGTVASTFFALEVFGNRRTLLLATLVNLLVAMTARAMSRTEGFARQPVEESPSPDPSAAGREAPVAFTWLAAAVTGFTFFLLELVWYRMLAPILGGTTFTFGVILAMALLGIGLGGLLYSLVGDNRAATLRLFAVTCGLEALAIAAPFALGDNLALLAVLLRPFDMIGFQGNIFSWTMICMIVALPAAVVSGFQFPALIALAGQGGRNVGSDVGRVYAFNTIGAISGSLAGGFGLMPLLTAPGCWKLCAWLMVGLCAAAALVSARQRKPAFVGPAFALLAAACLVLASGPSAAWRHVPTGAGRAALTATSANELAEWQRRQRSVIVMEAEGVESSVAISGGDGYAFLVNGKSDGHAIGDAPTQVMGGLVGAILHPQPKRSLVVGLGTGSTAGWLGKVAGMERVDVAELEPEIRNVARACATVNQAVLEQPNVHIFYGDAREMLLVTRDRYDIVFSEPSNPYRAGVAGLFTVEFYEAVSDKLARGGIFLQWVQAYEIDGSTLETIVTTLRRVFPHVQIWQTLDKDLILMASQEPVPVDANLIRARVGQEPFRTALRSTWLTDTAEGFLAHHVADDSLATMIANQPFSVANTDDRNVVEFGFARSVGRERTLPTAQIRALATRLDARDRAFVGSFDPKLVQRFRSTSPLIAGSFPQRDPELARAMEAYDQQRFREVIQIFERLELAPISRYETVMLAESLAQVGDERCLDYLGRVRSFDPVDALWIEAIYRYATGAKSDSARLLAEGAELRRSWPWVSRPIIPRAVALAERLVGSEDAETVVLLERAFSRPFAVGDSEASRRLFLLGIASRLEPSGCGPRTLAAIGLFEPHTPWLRGFLETRARCYSSAHHPLAAHAREELSLFNSRESQHFGAAIPAKR